MESAKHQASAQNGLRLSEFLAEDELIEISPMVSAGVVRLVAGDFGPFEPSISLQVPFWLALALKKVGRCKILPPRWLRHAEIEKITQAERDDESQLRPLPRFFSEIGALLLHNAQDDLESPARLRRALEDLSSIRSGKLRRFMQASVRDKVNAVKVSNLSSLEVEMNRSVLTKVLEGLYAVHVPELDGLTSFEVGNPSSAGGSGAENRRGADAPRELRRVIRRS